MLKTRKTLTCTCSWCDACTRDPEGDEWCIGDDDSWYCPDCIVSPANDFATVWTYGIGEIMTIPKKKVLDAACHQLAEFLLGLAHARMPANLKAKLMRLSCRQLVAALDGDADEHNRIIAQGVTLCKSRG
jgi:hypothetical protein